MRKDITVVAQPRDTRGKNEARRLRAQHLAPAVLYGAGKDSVAIAVSPKEINKIIHSASGHNTVFNLDIQSRDSARAENCPVMIVDTQRDPVKENILHADLLRIDMTKTMVVNVRVHVVGDPKGVKLQGGLLEVITREIAIECLPDDIPEHLTANVSELALHESLRAGDVPLTGSIKLVGHAEQVIAHVVGVKAEEAAPAAEGATGATPAEPEVIKKGKKEAEGEAPAADKKKK